MDVCTYVCMVGWMDDVITHVVDVSMRSNIREKQRAYHSHCHSHRETDRETDRETERDRERQRETNRQTDNNEDYHKISTSKTNKNIEERSTITYKNIYSVIIFTSQLPNILPHLNQQQQQK